MFVVAQRNRNRCPARYVSGLINDEQGVVLVWWACSVVDLWCGGHVVWWTCENVMWWSCGVVVMWCGGHMVWWSCGVVTCGVVDMWCGGHVVWWACDVMDVSVFRQAGGPGHPPDTYIGGEHPIRKLGHPIK